MVYAQNCKSYVDTLASHWFFDVLRSIYLGGVCSGHSRFRNKCLRLHRDYRINFGSEEFKLAPHLSPDFLSKRKFENRSLKRCQNKSNSPREFSGKLDLTMEEKWIYFYVLFLRFRLFP
jgi:hypothetical protein